MVKIGMDKNPSLRAAGEAIQPIRAFKSCREAGLPRRLRLLAMTENSEVAA
jgi:hypothetical protein